MRAFVLRRWQHFLQHIGQIFKCFHSCRQFKRSLMPWEYSNCFYALRVAVVDEKWVEFSKTKVGLCKTLDSKSDNASRMVIILIQACMSACPSKTFCHTEIYSFKKTWAEMERKVIWDSITKRIWYFHRYSVKHFIMGYLFQG